MSPICRSCLLLGGLLLTACASLPDYSHPVYEEHLPAPQSTELPAWAASLAVIHPQASGLTLLSEGTDAFIARLAVAANARSSLDLQYYLYHNDLTGRFFTRMLLDAADRGVRVRLLLDDMATRDADDYLRIINRHPNIHIRLFNPFEREYPRDMQFVTRYGISTRRMHNKSMIADNSVAIVGGRNIGDEYFDAARNDVVFGDLDVLTIGPVVEDISAEFDHYWNSELAVPAEYQLNDDPQHDPQALPQLRAQLDEWLYEQRDHPYGRQLRTRAAELSSQYQQRLLWGKAYVVADNPQKIADPGYQSPVLANMITLMQTASREVLLISPYFVPADEGVGYLGSLVKKGIRVRVITNSLASTDVPAVHSAYKHYRAALIRAGVELWELRPDAPGERPKSSWIGSSSASLHAKVLMIDQRYFYVGSMNFDPRSAHQNTEMGVLFEQPELGREASALLTSNLPHEAYWLVLEQGSLRWHEREPDGTLKIYDDEPQAGLWRRLQSWILGILPLESEL